MPKRDFLIRLAFVLIFLGIDSIFFYVDDSFDDFLNICYVF